MDFGTKGDGIAKDTQGIQNAIDTCTKNGGGTVWVPAGKFLCGTIVLKTNVELHLENGAILLCSTDSSDICTDEVCEDKAGLGVFLKAADADNISITGSGIIDGQGDYYLEADNGIDECPLAAKNPRPTLCALIGCTNVSIIDVTLRNAAFWCVHLLGCRKVNIRGIKILNNLRGPNNDGIDPDSCSDVHISDCHIEAGDDCIVLKTTKDVTKKYGACENVTVTNCTLVSRSTALKIGTETHGDVRNCVFSNCIIRDSNKGIGIWARDGGTIENIMFSNIIIETRAFKPGASDWWGKGEPIFISAEHRNDQRKYPGKIRNISITNIFAKSESCIFLSGCPESVIEDIEMNNIKLKMSKVSDTEAGVFDTRPSTREVFPHDIPCLFAEHGKNIRLKEFTIMWDFEVSPHWTNAIICENNCNLKIEDFSYN